MKLNKYFLEINLNLSNSNYNKNVLGLYNNINSRRISLLNKYKHIVYVKFIKNLKKLLIISN